MEYSRLEIAEEVIKQVNLGEPIAVFSMPGMGKHYERSLLGDLIAKDSKLQNHKIISKDLFTTEEMFEFLKEVENINEKTILILGICLNYGQDASWFIEQLNAIKDKKKNIEIATIIFTSPSAIFSAYKSKIRLITRVLDYKKPLEKDACLKLIQRYEEKYELSLTDEQKEKIFELAAGHIGMTKNLILEIKLNPDLDFSIENLMESESIKGWLFELTEDLHKELLEVLIGIREDAEISKVLRKCGYFNEKGEVFSPLFQKYLEKNLEKKFSTESFENKLTDQEIKAYQLLKNSNAKIVSRDDIAKAIWAEEWLEKYSDWAIDQLIHSLRDKIDAAEITSKITTLRGKGYKFTN